MLYYVLFVLFKSAKSVIRYSIKSAHSGNNNSSRDNDSNNNDNKD